MLGLPYHSNRGQQIMATRIKIIATTNFLAAVNSESKIFYRAGVLGAKYRIKIVTTRGGDSHHATICAECPGDEDVAQSYTALCLYIGDLERYINRFKNVKVL